MPIEAGDYEKHLRRLHLHPGANRNEIKRAFRREVLKCYPDPNDSTAEQQLRRIVEAFQYLNANSAQRRLSKHFMDNMLVDMFTDAESL